MGFSLQSTSRSAQTLQKNIFNKIYFMELDWPLPHKKQSPLYYSYSPDALNLSENFVNPFLGYPTSPIIGRYNRGEYKIGETLFQLEFKCKYNEKRQCYECGGRPIGIPNKMLLNLRNIPEAIANNKAAGIKNSPEILPQTYSVRDELSLYWIVSFGELGKDFLNYLNHMYVLAPYLFVEQKLKRNIHFLPIYAHLPELSGLNDIEVERGLNFNNYRGEYMSFHLAKGAPAFSPNNMRLSILGGKVITSKQPQKNQNKQKDQPKKTYIQKEKYEEMKLKQNTKEQIMEQKIKSSQLEPQIFKDKKIEDQMLRLNQNNQIEKTQKKVEVKQQSEVKVEIVQDPSLQNIQLWLFQQKPKEQHPEEKKGKKQKGNNNKNNRPKSPKLQHQGFIHFYTSVLLEEDYRLYYHWHIQDRFKEDLIKQIWGQSKSVEDFLSKYISFGGNNPLAMEASRLLSLDKR